MNKGMGPCPLGLEIWGELAKSPGADRPKAQQLLSNMLELMLLSY